MKVRCVSKLICLLTFVVTSSFCLSACSSEETPSIQILAAGSSVFPESFDSEATEWISNYTDGEETSVEIRSMYLGEGEKDLYGGANVAKVSAMAAGKEIDIMICDLDNAARFARSEMFVPIKEVFTEEELTGHEDQLLTFEKVDDEGNLNGEYTEACGVSIDGIELFDSIYKDSEYGIFLINNADPMETSKDIFKNIVNFQ